MIKIKNRQMALKFSRAPFAKNAAQVQSERPIAQRKCQSSSTLRQQKQNQIRSLLHYKKTKKVTPQPLLLHARPSLQIIRDQNRQQRDIKTEYEFTNPTILQSENQNKSTILVDNAKHSSLPFKIFTMSLHSQLEDTLGLRKTHNLYMKRTGGTRQKIDPYLYYQKMKDKLKNQHRHQYHSSLVINKRQTNCTKGYHRKDRRSTIQIDGPPLTQKYNAKLKSKVIYSQRKDFQPRPWSACKSETNQC